MKEAFEKIVERLERPDNYTIVAGKHFTTVERVNEIVNQVAEEFKNKFVSIGAYNQVAWERYIAISQLHELGYEFGQKIDNGWIPCNDRMLEARKKIIEEFAVKLCHELPKHADEITMEDFIIYDVLTVDGVLDIVIKTAERMKNGEINNV